VDRARYIPGMGEPTAAADDLVLDPTEQRVLGSLLEKQVTVPATYPLSLNSLRVACNQATSREPVVDYDEPTVQECLRGLRQRELVRVVHGDRVLKYHQVLSERLELADDERALVTVLLLRGPQSAGELKTRTDRLHPFADRGAVQACLAGLAGRATPLVRELPKVAGQHDPRWIHLLGPVESALAEAADAAALAPDREIVLAEGPEARDAKVLALWEAVAGEYAATHGDPLDPSSFDAWLLGRVAAAAGIDPVADVGCGPGAVTRVLADAGAQVTGVDLSPVMVEWARAAHPELAFEAGDLRRLMRPRLAPAWGAIVAWYAVIHLAPSELGPTLAGMARVLRPGGWLALAVHVGADLEHLETWFGVDVDADIVRFEVDEVLAAVRGAGLEVLEWYLRGPVGQSETTPKLYVVAARTTA